MSVQMICPNKGCGKFQAPTINPKTDEVFCSVCDLKIENVNHFIKIQLKTLKQYKEQKKVAFGVKCQKCGKEDKPKDTGTDIVCGACGKPLDQLTETFKRMLKTQLSKTNNDV